MVNETIVNRLLNNIESYTQELRSASDITYGTFMADIRSQRFVERTIHIAIEACFDVVHHIISDEGWREPASYADAFQVLAENKVLAAESLQRFTLMAQFRNKLVHYYEKIEPVQVYAIFSKHLSDFDVLIRAIRSWLTTMNSNAASEQNY